MANLGTKSHTAGNHTIYTVDYDAWLDDGVSIADTPTVTMDAAFTATVTDVTISSIVSHPRHITFMLAGGSVNETFTLDVQVTDSRGETKNDTLGFQVIAP